MKWTKIESLKDLPSPAVDILFTDGEWMYIGWLDPHLDEETPVFYNNMRHGFVHPANITHWMPLPDFPKEPESEKIHFGPSPDDP